VSYYSCDWMEGPVAQQVNVVLVDDLDGSEASESVSFGLDGRSYEIDLSGANTARLREILAPYVEAARRGTGARRPVVAPAAPRSTSNREETAAVREWARTHGFTVSERGRIPNSVIEAYAAHQTVAAPEPVVADTPPPAVDAPTRRTRARKVPDPFTIEAAG
jgi:hypothetical protein